MSFASSIREDFGVCCDAGMRLIMSIRRISFGNPNVNGFLDGFWGFFAPTDTLTDAALG